MLTSPTAPPAATLVRIFAHELVELDDWKSQGSEVPGAGVKVKTRPLAAHVWAVTFWSLREQGLLALEHEEKKRLGFRTVRLRARLTAPATARPGWIETRLLLALADGGSHDVDDVVHTAIEEDRTDPRSWTAYRATEDGVPSGLFVEEHVPGTRLRSAYTLVHPQLDRFADARPAFDELAAGWRAFVAAEPALADALLSRCDKGVGRRKEQEELE